MGCHVCGRRQVDPDSGPSAWRRGVVAGRQVLVCPECQVEGWTDALDRCRSCGSTALVKRLGETVCRTCGGSEGAGDAPGPTSVDGPDARRDDLAADVAAALERVLRGEPGG